MEYRIVEGEPYEITEQVQKFIAEGWEPLGGVAVTEVRSPIVPEHITTVMYQAMIRTATPL